MRDFISNETGYAYGILNNVILICQTFPPKVGVTRLSLQFRHINRLEYLEYLGINFICIHNRPAHPPLFILMGPSSSAMVPSLNHLQQLRTIYKQVWLRIASPLLIFLNLNSTAESIISSVLCGPRTVLSPSLSRDYWF